MYFFAIWFSLLILSHSPVFCLYTKLKKKIKQSEESNTLVASLREEIAAAEREISALKQSRGRKTGGQAKINKKFKKGDKIAIGGQSIDTETHYQEVEIPNISVN